MKTIYLIGFMGSGKSTIGRQLAQELAVSFIDTDDYIEQKYNQQIPEIFSQHGEDTFREYETNALKEVSSYSIVATGGGIVERERNKEILKNGSVIYLATAFAEIVKRLQGDESRPLWQGSNEQQKELYDRREQSYEQFADITIRTSNKKIENIITEIISYIKE